MSSDDPSTEELRRRLAEVEARLAAMSHAAEEPAGGEPYTEEAGAVRSAEVRVEPYAVSNEDLKRRLVQLERRFETLTSRPIAADVVELPFVPEPGDVLKVRIDRKDQTCRVLQVDRGAQRAIVKVGARRYNVSFSRFVDVDDVIEDDDDTREDTGTTKRRTTTARRRDRDRDKDRDKDRDRDRSSARLVRGTLHAIGEGIGAFADTFTGFADNVLDRNRGKENESADRLNRRFPGDVASGFSDAIEDLFDIPSKMADRFNERYKDRD